MYNIAVILAGGIGARVGGGVPKQLLPLADGRSVLEHAVSAFEQSPCIDEVCIVMHPDYIAYAEQMLLANAWQKVRHIIPGGKERWESSVNAIRAFTPYTLHPTPITNLLLHDAARPFVSQDIIAHVCEALQEHDAVTVAIPSTDTVYEMADGKVARIPQRSTIMRAQTPQAFRLELIAGAYAKALGVDNLNAEVCAVCSLPATDDCGIVHEYMPEIPIYIVEGEEQNKKITFKHDI
jgi:2-C-methyl-D-erythritol 4-phosphate cytidylyltransferase